MGGEEKLLDQTWVKEVSSSEAVPARIFPPDFMLSSLYEKTLAILGIKPLERSSKEVAEFYFSF